MQETSGPPLPGRLGLDRRQGTELGDRLRFLGFRPEAVEPFQQTPKSRPAPGLDIARVRRCKELGDLGTVLQLFVFDEAVEASRAESAVAPLTLTALCEAGILATDDHEVRSAIRLTPFADHIVATDRTEHYGDPQFVLQVTPSAILLASAALFPTTGRVLDLACGAGLHAVIAAARGAATVATDMNPRAAMFVNLNAALNGVTIDARTGNLWEPVRNDKFDLILANAPFILSPDSARMFLTGSGTLDDFSKTLASGVGQHLTDSGICQFLTAWPHVEGEDPNERVLSWFDGFAGDVWAIEFSRADIVEHTTSYLDTSRGENEFQRWIDHFAEHRVVEVVDGLLTLTAGPQKGLRTVSVEPAEVDRPFSGHLRQVLEARQLVHTNGADWLRSCSLKVSDALVVVSEGSIAAGGVERIQLHQRQGIHHRIDVEPTVVDLLAGCDGSRSLATVIEGVSAARGLAYSAAVDGLTDIAEQCLYSGMLTFTDR